MKRYLLAGILAVLGASPANTQVMPPQGEGPSVATGSVPLTYTGGDSRVSVGVDQDGNSQGELMQVFGNNGEHAVVAQLWWGHGGAGGVQADYNWLVGSTLEQARQDPDSITVAKLSFAIDQNSEKDRLANVGLSIERKEFFLNFFLSGKASGARNAGAVSTQQQEIVSGTDATGIYTQTRTDIATTQLLAQPYSTIVGIHGGHFSNALAARFNGGIDYSKGNQGASQKRVSVGIDKYLGTRGWSVSGIAEHAENTSAVGSDSSDNRWWLFLRYEFGGGGAFRPFDDSAAANAAWIDRALREPVTGHARNVDTYVTTGKTTTTTTLGPKQYSARVPIARDDAISVVEDSSASEIDVLGNDSDPDNNAIAISTAGPASHGTVQIEAGHVLYTPTPGFVGSDAFPYTIVNSKGLSASATVHVTVTTGTPPPNQGAPVARDDTTTTPYAQPVTVAVLGNDSDPNGYPLTVTAATTPAHGSSHVNGDSTITYTPNATFTGSDRFSYSIDNGHGGTASANVTIVVQPPAPPQARDDSATTVNPKAVDIDVLANDTDPAGYPLTVISVTSPANGTATILTSGAVRYAPALGFSGNDTFTYTVSDGHGGVASAKVSVTVLAQSGTFQVRDDSATTAYATPITIDVLANDSAPDGATLTIKKITSPQNGTAAYSPAGIIYTPSAAFYGGTDTFEYTVGDGSETATATVTVKVLPPGNPVAQDDKATTPFATAVVVTVLANDSDPNHFALTVTSIPATPAHGTAQVNPDNTITYTPLPNYSGSDAFSYAISNGHGGTATATVTITVQAALPPVARADGATTAFNTPVVVAVLTNDSDPNSLALSVTMTTTPAHGSVQINANNTITYTPALNYSGSDSFDYTITNTQGQTASANVAITVQAPPLPVANDDTPPAIVWNTQTDIAVTANDTGLGLTVKSFTQPSHGSTAPSASPGKVTYTPAHNYVGSDSFQYTIEDTFHNTSTATVTLTVSPPPPVTVSDFSAQCVSDGSECHICLSNNITNPLELPTTVSVSQPALAPDSSVTQPAIFGMCDNDVVYIIDTGQAAMDSFTFTVSDPYHTQPSVATVTVNVSAP